jgi:hypothetical protein|tara:strand:- start:113 stop:673 length:561 start_codon:yes stop_codon:yes gene_type:complete
MASPNFAKKNPFMGMTVAQMKAYYDKKVRGKKLSAAELKSMANQMQAAKKAAPKAKPAAKTKPAASKTRQTTKEEAKSRFFRSSSGTRGQSRPSNSPSPAVRRRGSATGASVDPRERQLRKNRQQARRSTTGSSTAGRRNIARQVAEQSGSAKRNQRQVEARRRRAREQAAARNRRLMLSRKYNKD